MFFVRPEDLAAGQVRFQCIACESIFGFDWPQPPGVTVVQSVLIEKPAPQKTVEMPERRATLRPEAEARTAAAVSPVSEPVSATTPTPKTFAEPGKPTRTCINCNSQVEYKYLECPKCGIIFDKVKRIRPPEPVVPAANGEIMQAWEAVRANYDDTKCHEAFIQLCMAKENLAFAGSQYRSILQVNPTEETATKMQNRIIEMATMAYVAQAQVAREKAPKRSVLSNLVLVVGILLIATGLAIAQARSLVALGVSFVVFVVALRYFSRG